jgi:glycosyltransferase 2 family protein
VRADWRSFVRLGVGLAVGVLAVTFLRDRWDGIRLTVSTLRPSWSELVAASACMLASYGILVAAWRALLGAWDNQLSWLAATRIWFVSALGKYVPGKVWSIAAMALLAKEAGVQPLAATGSAIIGQLLNIAAGALVIAVAGAGSLFTAYPAYRTASWAIIGMSIVGLSFGPQLLTWAIGVTSRVLKRPVASVPSLSRSTLLVLILANVASWLAYGIGFGLFWHGLLGRGGGAPAAVLAVYTASYLLGFLALPVPGGIGVRETALVAMLVSLRLAPPADAAVLATASRVWLTVLEIVPGLVFLPGISLRRRSTLPTSDGPTL